MSVSVFVFVSVFAYWADATLVYSGTRAISILCIVVLVRVRALVFFCWSVRVFMFVSSLTGPMPRWFTRVHAPSAIR